MFDYSIFDYRRERRRLQRENKAFDEKWYHQWVNGAPDRKIGDLLSNEEHLSELQELKYEINANESRRLFSKAKRLGIDVREELPPSERDWGGPMWWEGDVREEGDAAENEFWCTVLNEKGVTRLNRIIKDRQYELLKKWTDLLAPILSTVISILALLIAILALYLQASSDNIIIIPPPT